VRGNFQVDILQALHKHPTFCPQFRDKPVTGFARFHVLGHLSSIILRQFAVYE
jgi:hypothetical protein